MKQFSINTGWQFAKLPGVSHAAPSIAGAAWETLDLPHTWYRDDDQYRGLAVYQKIVEVDCGPDQSLILELGAADHTVRAYANGVELGLHKGGYSRVRFAVPMDCVKDGKIDFILYVDNGATEDVSPLAGDFTVFGGLYRGASLLVTEKSHFDYLYHATDGVIVRTSVDEIGSGVLYVEPHAVVEGTGKVRYTLWGPDGSAAARFEGPANDPQEVVIPSVCLWNGKGDPALYTLEAELEAGGAVVDRTTVTTGFRKVAIDPNAGFFLNGSHMRINGVAKHQDFAGRYSAVTEREIDRDFDLIADVGANAVRLSHYQHPQYTYDKCDKAGLVVWAEIPMLKMTEDPALQENARQQMTELVLQNIHHPSICFWGVQNEIAMFRDAAFVHENIKELYDLTKALDPDRIVTCANLHPLKAKSQLNHLTDMVGYNIYFGWYYGKMGDYGPYLDGLHRELPQMPLGISEYGVDCATWLHSENPLVKDYSEEFQALFHETVYSIVESKPYLWGSFIWNFFDFSSSRRNEGGQKFINAKGLVTFDRETKKDAFYCYKAKWSDEPFLHIRERRFTKRCRDAVDVKVYTNLPQVTLVLPDGETVAARNDGNGCAVFPGVALSEGKTTFTVTADGDGRTFTDSVTFEKVSEPEDSYAIPDSGAGTTVQNWFLGEDDIDTDSYFSLKDRAEDILENEQAHAVFKKYLPGLTAVLERGVIPLGLAMTSILSRDTPKDVDLKELNLELMKITK